MNVLGLAQAATIGDDGRISVSDDWFERPLPANVVLEEMSYPDTAYSFQGCRSKEAVAFRLGYGSGNYGHSTFLVSEDGSIDVGDFVVLQSTRLVCSRSIKIGDHCMFSWGSVLTDSWIFNVETTARRQILRDAAASTDRILRFPTVLPVTVEVIVWVGFGAVIMPGVTLGRGSVIGCNSLVGDDVEPYAVVVGNPARVVRYLEPTDTPDVKRRVMAEFGILRRGKH